MLMPKFVCAWYIVYFTIRCTYRIYEIFSPLSHLMVVAYQHTTFQEKITRVFKSDPYTGTSIYARNAYLI